MDSSSSAVYLPWAATADEATTTLNGLLGATTTAEGVYVTRGGDGHATATFTILFLKGGAQPMLQAASSAGSTPLVKTAFSASRGSATTSTAVTVSLEQVAPGGIDLLPLPGRYLSAPMDQVALQLRLGAQTTARCAAPDWDALHVGCFLNGSYTNAYDGESGDTQTYPSGFSLERCALYCSAKAASAVAFAASKDVCTCLSAATLPSRGAATFNSNCSATCSAEDVTEGSQLCGNRMSAEPALLTRWGAAMSSTLANTPMLLASNCISGVHDGWWSDPGGMCHSQTQYDPWISIELAATSYISSTQIYNRRDCCQDRLPPFEVYLGDSYGDMSREQCGSGAFSGDEYNAIGPFDIACRATVAVCMWRHRSSRKPPLTPTHASATGATTISHVHLPTRALLLLVP